MSDKTAQVKLSHIPRATKACLQCRRQKTRCFPSPSSVACLRCISLGKPCSFLKESTADKNNKKSGSQIDRKRKFDNSDDLLVIPDELSVTTIGKDVKKILSILESHSSTTTASSSFQNDRFFSSIIGNLTSTDILFNNNMITGDENATSMNDEFENFQPDQECAIDEISTISSPWKTSPIMMIHSSVPTDTEPLSVRQILSNQPNKAADESSDIISLKIITLDDATLLVDNFKECYGRWISLPKHIDSTDLVRLIRTSSSLLLTAICCTSLRFVNNPIRQKAYFKLLKQLKLELSEALANSKPKNLDHLKALVILSVYGYSLSSPEFIIDPWFISGVAIKEFLTIDIRGELLNIDSLKESLDLEEEMSKLSNFRIWNHICLVHLVNCVFSGRMCILDEIRLDQSRKSLDLSQTTNFDGRMLSEVSLQLLLYNYLQTASNGKGGFETFEEDLKIWLDQWNYLFRQPTLQFVEFGYHYAYIVALCHWQLGKQAVTDITNGMGENEREVDIIQDKTTLNRLAYHCLKNIDYINDIKDNLFFFCLSDQVHLCTMYIGLVFIKVIKWGQINDVNRFKNADIVEFISKLKSLITKLKSLSPNANDLVNQYAAGLQSSLNELINGL